MGGHTHKVAGLCRPACLTRVPLRPAQPRGAGACALGPRAHPPPTTLSAAVICSVAAATLALVSAWRMAVCERTGGQAQAGGHARTGTGGGGASACSGHPGMHKGGTTPQRAAPAPAPRGCPTSPPTAAPWPAGPGRMAGCLVRTGGRAGSSECSGMGEAIQAAALLCRPHGCSRSGSCWQATATNYRCRDRIS